VGMILAREVRPNHTCPSCSARIVAPPTAAPDMLCRPCRGEVVVRGG
jgi:hypothetical protein